LANSGFDDRSGTQAGIGIAARNTTAPIRKNKAENYREAYSYAYIRAMTDGLRGKRNNLNIL
jgi:hypothetical protein